MKITAVNSQNNNYSNKQSKPVFGMHFPNTTIEGIKLIPDGLMSLEITQTLAKLKSRSDNCVLTYFKIQLYDPPASSRNFWDFATHTLNIDVEDKHGIQVYHLFNKAMTERNLLRKLQYLASERFLRKVARLDKRNAAKAAAIEAERQAREAAEQERKRLLGYITETTEAELIKKTLPPFVKISGYPRERAGAVLSKLVEQGIRTEKGLLQIAIPMNPDLEQMRKFKRLGQTVQTPQPLEATGS